MLGDAVTVLFIAGFGPVVRDAAPTRKLYIDDLGILFMEEAGGYLHTEALQGAKTFALWPLSEAAQSCFGSASWPSDVPVPQAWLEFEVDSVQNATAALERRGHRILRQAPEVIPPGDGRAQHWQGRGRRGRFRP
jgi:hypothetical protein